MNPDGLYQGLIDDTPANLDTLSQILEIEGYEVVQFPQGSLALTPAYADQIDEEYIRDIYHAAPLYGIGKIGISDNILLKHGKLTKEEFDAMKNHVNIGVRALMTVLNRYPKHSFIKMGIGLTLGHHEKWDGSGYPNIFSGEDIPLSGRTMAISDVYDALRSRRPYKVPLEHEVAVGVILEGSGTHFDPIVVESFVRLCDKFGEYNDSMSDLMVD